MKFVGGGGGGFPANNLRLGGGEFPCDTCVLLGGNACLGIEQIHLKSEIIFGH